MPVDNGISILLVEDAAVMLKMEAKTLQTLGFNKITEAKDGDEAITLLGKNPNFDLVISDWNMPNVSGYDLLVWIRKNESTKHIPFIMATGRGERKEMNKASEAGVSSFISKPFNAKELSEKIEEAFGKKTKEKQVSRQTEYGKSGKVVMRIGHIQITDHLVLGVLKHLIETGELNPQHFELETMCMSSWNPVSDALENGAIDGACVLAPIAMDLFSYNVPLSLILFAHRNGSISVRNKKGGEFSEPYQNFYRNKSFYIPHTMSIHNMLGHIFFKGIGLQPGVVGQKGVDVSFEVAPPVKMPEFLGANPNACGYLVAEPLGTKAIASGIAELQFLSSEIWDQHPCCVVTMQKDFINKHEAAVYEFTKMLVTAGNFIAEKPSMSAEIAVQFLDPDGSLGLKVPLLKNVLTEPKGIKTDNLYPSIEDLDKIQHYMHDQMGIGNLIDLEEFVDLRFANAANIKTEIGRKKTQLLTSSDAVGELLSRSASASVDQRDKSLINKEGKYLTLLLGEQQFGIDILKIREIIGLMPIRKIPKAPPSVKGMINLRNRIIPVIDLRLRLGMQEFEYTDRSVIVILEIGTNGSSVQVGVIVDAVSDISDIKVNDLEDTPSFGVNTNTDYILAIAKSHQHVRVLLDIDRILTDEESKVAKATFQVETD